MTKLRISIITGCYISFLAITGCHRPPVGPSVLTSFVYEEIQLPTDIGQDIRLRLRRMGLKRGEENIQYIDVSYGNKDFRLYIGSPPSYWITSAEDKKLLCKEKPVSTKLLGGHYGLGPGPGGTTEEWLETTQAMLDRESSLGPSSSQESLPVFTSLPIDRAQEERQHQRH